MTVNFEVPYIEYVANGTTTRFTFAWSSGDAGDNYVLINSALAAEGVEYELEDWTEAEGGAMVFNPAPDADTRIVIFRRTPITQQIDYVEGEPFPANIHERGMDKDTRILQEINLSGAGEGGIVDLGSNQQPFYTEITNSSGSNAIIEPWTVDGLQSGISLGEVVPYGQTLPQDTAPTDKPDGYIWWGLGAASSGGGDAQITMFTAAISAVSSRVAPNQPRAEFAYDASTGFGGWGYDQTLPAEIPAWMEQPAFASPITVPATYLIQLEFVNGVTPQGSAMDTWLDAVYDASWYITSGDFVGIVSIAPDDGAGNPVNEFKISRYVTLSAEQT